eukprot:scaffold102415_cov24-Phaeocystis_antarctica.AAC.1
MSGGRRGGLANASVVSSWHHPEFTMLARRFGVVFRVNSAWSAGPTKRDLQNYANATLQRCFRRRES